MTEALPEILALGQAGLAVGVAVFLRVGAAMAVLPAFGERSVPMRVRLGLALAFTAIVAPAVSESVAPVADAPQIFLTEPLIGVALGLAIRLFVMALQVAGAIAAHATSLAQLFGAAAVDPQPAMGHLMLVGGLALAAMAGLHVRVAEALIGSYAALPAGRWPDAGVMSQWGLRRVAAAFGLAFSLAAPFVLASMVYNLALGVINRAMPQLMVAFVGAPALTAGGLILLFLSLPLLLSVWIDGFTAYLADPFGAGP